MKVNDIGTQQKAYIAIFAVKISFLKGICIYTAFYLC
jgi:hypothetical protein